MRGTHARKQAPVGMVEGIKWRTDWNVRKFSALDTALLSLQLRHAPSGEDFEAHSIAPYEQLELPGNLLTSAGLTRITSLIIAAGGQGLTNTATRIGVGNSSTAATTAQTDLSAASGSTNRYFQPMDASFPSAAVGVITARATFGTADGNFAWNEFCLDIGTPTVTGGTTVNATMLNRKVISAGTKVLGQTWVAIATVTLA